MVQVAQKPAFEVGKARTLIKVPHLDGKLIFAHPVKGPNVYNNVGEQIDQDKTPSQLYRPTSSQKISLVHGAFQEPDNKYAQEVLEILKGDYKFLWCFTKNLWTPENHVFVVNDIDGSALNRKNLEKRLGSKEEDGVVYSDDGVVRFVPRDRIRLGEQTTGQLEKNGYIRAHAEGQEGAQKLAKIASEFREKPCVYGLEDVTQDIETKTDLDAYWGSYRLYFDGNYFDGGRDGCAFGVQK